MRPHFFKKVFIRFIAGVSVCFFIVHTLDVGPFLIDADVLWRLKGISFTIWLLTIFPALPVGIKQLAKDLAGHAKNFRRVFSEGTMPERKVFVRAHVHSIKIQNEKRLAIIQYYRLPQTPRLQELTSSGAGMTQRLMCAASSWFSYETIYWTK